MICGTFPANSFLPSSAFRATYMDEFPFDRHNGKCSYVMLDGHAQVMVVPSSNTLDANTFEDHIREQLQTACDGEQASPGPSTEMPHVCFWSRYQRGMWYSHPWLYEPKLIGPLY